MPITELEAQQLKRLVGDRHEALLELQKPPLRALRLGLVAGVALFTFFIPRALWSELPSAAGFALAASCASVLFLWWEVVALRKRVDALVTLALGNTQTQDR